jgi:hypothetical protein
MFQKHGKEQIINKQAKVARFNLKNFEGSKTFGLYETSFESNDKVRVNDKKARLMSSR